MHDLLYLLLIVLFVWVFCFAAALMNIITCDRAFCLYPSTTFGTGRSLLLNNGDRTYLKHRRPSRNEELCQVTHNFCCEIERAYERLPDDTLIPQAVVKDTIGETCKRYGERVTRTLGDEYCWPISFDWPRITDLGDLGHWEWTLITCSKSKTAYMRASGWSWWGGDT